MPLSLRFPALVSGPALLLAAGLARPAQAQDAYFSQSFATRLHQNPAFAGLLDDYSVTFAFRNQLPSFAGSYRSLSLAADLRPDRAGQHHAAGLLLNQDRSGMAGYTRLEAGGIYTYHTRLTQPLALAAGLRASYGRQTLGSGNYLFGDQIAPDGALLGPSAEAAAFVPVNYFSLGTGAVLYTERGWLSLAGQHLNQPSLSQRPRKGASLPLLLQVGGGYKFYLQRPGLATAANPAREISFTPVGSYARQGGSGRSEAGLYFAAGPVTLGALYRNISLATDVETQQALVVVAGVQAGALRLGYSYDAALNTLSAELGGAHEVTLCLRAFDPLEQARRRQKRRAYPVIPCPAL